MNVRVSVHVISHEDKSGVCACRSVSQVLVGSSVVTPMN